MSAFQIFSKYYYQPEAEAPLNRATRNTQLLTSMGICGGEREVSTEAGGIDGGNLPLRVPIKLSKLSLAHATPSPYTHKLLAPLPEPILLVGALSRSGGGRRESGGGRSGRALINHWEGVGR